MSEEEYNTLLEEFDVIVKQMELVAKINGIDEAKPMTFPFDDKVTYLRKKKDYLQFTILYMLIPYLIVSTKSKICFSTSKIYQGIGL